ncbi:tyrosinase family oxidase copper chaperone [Streptomyces sp. NPDC049837]|uniref:tyrosinase family oxidase copper chaperone n=1 Tax=Streptomyces sp. NPDC049837 TaxID=3155277 RepID=UPI00341466D4
MTTPSRRTVLKQTAAVTAFVGGGAVIAGLGTAAAAPTPAPPEGEGFTEVYKGRRIEVTPVAATVALRTSTAAARTAAAPVDVRIDGRPLHIMRRADGSYLSVVNHYESFPTAQHCARAAVDQLGPASQLAAGNIHHH